MRAGVDARRILNGIGIVARTDGAPIADRPETRPRSVSVLPPAASGQNPTVIGKGSFSFSP